MVDRDDRAHIEFHGNTIHGPVQGSGVQNVHYHFGGAPHQGINKTAPARLIEGTAASNRVITVLRWSLRKLYPAPQLLLALVVFVGMKLTVDDVHTGAPTLTILEHASVAVAGWFIALTWRIVHRRLERIQPWPYSRSRTGR